MAEVALARKEAEDLDTLFLGEAFGSLLVGEPCCVFPRHPLALVVQVEVFRQTVLPNLDSL